MYPFQLVFDWTDEELAKVYALDNLNLLNVSDPLYEFAENLSIRSDMTTVVCHGNETQLGSVIYSNGRKIENKEIEIDDLAQLIKKNAQNEVIILFACKAGMLKGSSPAQKLANKTKYAVWAPLDTIWVNTNQKQKFYVNNESISNPDSEYLKYEYQRKMWLMFTPMKGTENGMHQ